MSEQPSARRLAFHSLLKCHRDKKYSNIELDSVIKQNNLEPRERALFTALVYGVIEKRITLDYIISRLSDRPLDKIVPAVMTALEMGIYQILYFDRVPDSAACNESVEIAKITAGKGAASFVNALLREVTRRKDGIEKLYENLDGYEFLSVKYSLPKWMVELFATSYGEEKAIEIMEALNGKAHMTLHADTLRISRDELVERLKADKIAAAPCETVQSGVKLLTSTSTEILKKYDGLCFVQDVASQYAVQKLETEAGDFVIDCCACPGGKSLAAALDMGGVGSVLALDLHKNKLSLIEKSAAALGIEIIKTAAHDGTSPLEEYIGKADKVICDVPCSGLGVIHKKPDIRHKNPEDIVRLPQTQYKILSSAAAYLKKGGKLLYSTCTLNKDENERVVEKFLDENDGFASVFQTTLFPSLSDGVTTNDGFFISIFRRL